LTQLGGKAGARTLEEELTPRQRQILEMIAQGLTYKEAGVLLHVSENTVKYHMGQIMDRLHLQNRAQVLAHAGRMSWTGVPADS